VARSQEPQEHEPAHTAQRIVARYAARLHVDLWVLLVALPAAAPITGCVTLARGWA
jgi:hypothetical protein